MGQGLSSLSYLRILGETFLFLASVVVVVLLLSRGWEIFGWRWPNSI